MYTTRIPAVKSRVANFEMYTIRIFGEKIRVENSKQCAQLGFLR